MSGSPKRPARSRARRTAPPLTRAAASPVAAPPRIARVAKGRKPQYFSDPATDKLMWMTLTLMEELAVTRDRLDTVERLLEARRVVRRADIERFEPPPPAAAEREARRAAFVDRVLRAVEAELEAATATGTPRSVDEAVEAVES
jgi:hypothetical protein